MNGTKIYKLHSLFETNFVLFETKVQVTITKII